MHILKDILARIEVERQQIRSTLRRGKSMFTRSECPFVQIGVLGQPNIGKTMLSFSLHSELRAFVTPSNLMFGFDDPIKHLEFDKELQINIDRLRREDISANWAVKNLDYYAWKGHEKLAGFRLPDVIGHTYCTIPEDRDKIKNFDWHLDHLAKANVLWTVLAIPSSKDSGLLEQELARALAFHRYALSESNGEPCVQAIVLSRIDTFYASEQEARSNLSAKSLRQALFPLVSYIETSSQIQEAAIFPISSFGFGKAIRRQTQESSGDSSSNSGSANERWLLKPGANIEPFNVRALILWSLLTGLSVQKTSESVDGMNKQALCNQLSGDLRAIENFVVPIKGEWTSKTR